ncbi:hypothetical protein EGW08_008063 [Elysia chlorotica]|uniref:U6 snRNA phosphodiesterase n=1 Tax=Elysia chlorotica TaxID=188477 RepID=A0A433TRT1_ELYCH|nr:hypothetical protein EGW08_008063 [Elysia chlorotica]
MSCLVSYSGSSDEDGDENPYLESHCSKINLRLSDPSQEKVISATNKYCDSLPLSSKDICNEETGGKLMKGVEPKLTRPSKCVPEKRVDAELSRKRKLAFSEKESLNLPTSIQNMYENKHHVPADNPAMHQNRVRSFPHEVGNWATYVYIPVRKDERLLSFVQNVTEQLLPQGFEILPEFHVSLSRTVAIRHHWIEPLVDSLKDKLQDISTSVCEIVDVKLFTNDEKTRTFVCLELADDDTELLKYVEAVDSSFKDFRLAPYYENPSFHISVGWCLGDIVSNVSRQDLSKAKDMLSEFVAAHPDLSIVYAHEIICRSGNKSFGIKLKESFKGG